MPRSRGQALMLSNQVIMAHSLRPNRGEELGCKPDVARARFGLTNPMAAKHKNNKCKV